MLGPSAGEIRDFSRVGLETESDGFGWRAPSCVLTMSYQDVAESNPVSFLLDNGITEMLIFLAESRRPPGLRMVQNPPCGVTIGVDLRGRNGVALSYQFTTCGPQPALIQPPDIQLRSGSVATAANLNTGFTVLDLYAYLFDYGEGQMGFLRNP